LAREYIAKKEYLERDKEKEKKRLIKNKRERRKDTKQKS
jgi:hypothetical protein